MATHVRMRLEPIARVLLSSLGVMMAIVATIVLAAPASSSAQTAPGLGRTVKVGYIDYAGMISDDGDGTYSGYGVDYITEIRKATGWNVEYVPCTWSELVGTENADGTRTGSKLLDGEVDFVIHAQRTDARERDFIFAKYPTGYESTVVYARTDETDMYYSDPQSLNDRKIGLLKGSFQTETFLKYAQDNSISVTPVYYSSDTEMKDAIARGDVDCIVTGSLSYYNDLKVVLRQGAEPFYFMTSPANADLVEQLDDAMSNLLISEPALTSDLLERYYGTSVADSTPLFTREESAYIASTGTINVGVMPSRQPLSFVDANGDIRGVNEDVMDEVSRVSGLTFNYVPLDKTERTLDALKSGKIDIMLGVSSDKSNTTNPELTLSDPFMSANIIPVVRNGESFDPNEAGVKLAIPKSYAALESYLKRTYPSLEIVMLDSNEQCLEALANNEVNAFMQNEYVLRYLLQSPRFSELTALDAYSIKEDAAIAGLSETTSPLLFSILNKSINAIPSSTISQIVVAQTVTNAYPYSAADIIHAYGAQIAITLAAAAAIIVTLLAYLASRRKHEEVLQQKNDQLAESVRVADAASTAKTDFLAQMSHEIRTPMNAIIGMTTIAKSEVGNPERVMGDLDKIELSSKLLLNLINDILDMTAIENQKLRIDSTTFNFKQLILSICTTYYAQCRSKHMTFTSHSYGDIDEQLVGDPLRINQILLNLLSNAVKFTDPGGTVDLTIREMKHRDDRAFIRFEVTDDGCGMSEEMQERLFQPFEQESAGVARKHGGSGLGLSIAKNLIEMMHGTIKVESTKGVGTKFTVDLPLGVVAEDTDKPRTLSDGKMRALVVDDDDDALRYTSSILDRLQIDHVCESDPEHALELMGDAEDEDNPFTLIFVDWKMPSMDGMAFTREVRQVFGPDAVVIVVSAYDLDEIERDARSVGVDYFMSKPIFQSTVYDVLATINNGGIATVSKAATEYDFTGTRVLVAEDVELNMEVAVRLLEMVNVTVERAEDGKQAVKMFMENDPGYYDIIFMDINMPNMDGYEATRAIRTSNHPDAGSVPIYAMTANAFTEDVAKALSSGMNGHVSKPIDTAKLYGAIQTEIDKGNVHEQG